MDDDDNNLFEGSSTSRSTKNQTKLMQFMNKLDKIQEEQMVLVKKLDKEKARRDQLEIESEEKRQLLMHLRAVTRNGDVNLHSEQENKKKLHRLEHQLQMLNVKLSVARKENLATKKKVDVARRDKLLSIDILTKMEKELDDCNNKIALAQKDMSVVNEKTHRTKVAIGNMKHKMIKDMEEFTHDMHQAQMDLSLAQNGILDTIRERLKSTAPKTATTNLSPKKLDKSALKSSLTLSSTADEKDEAIRRLLETLGLSSLTELVQKTISSDEKLFAIYNDIQEKNTEMEAVEIENKRLETELASKVSELDKLEGHNNQVRTELEIHIASIQKAIAKYDQDYASNLDVISSISDTLLLLLSLVASDEEALDQQILSTGITDRNIDIYLGLVEQRIDELIQMHKVSNRMPITKDDFVFGTNNGRLGTIQVPNLPSLQDGRDDDEDDNDDAKIQPININSFKDQMMKKLNRSMLKKQAMLHNENDVPSNNQDDAAVGDNLGGTSSPAGGRRSLLGSPARASSVGSSDGEVVSSKPGSPTSKSPRGKVRQ